MQGLPEARRVGGAWRHRSPNFLPERLQRSIVLAALSISALLAVPAYLDRRVRFVVPYPPGGNVDIAARGS